MSSTWHPRGEPTWRDWKVAPVGTRVRHNRSGRTGTLRRVVGAERRSGGSRYAVIQWDNDKLGRPVEPGAGVVGRVVAPAFDLTPIEGQL